MERAAATPITDHSLATQDREKQTAQRARAAVRCAKQENPLRNANQGLP